MQRLEGFAAVLLPFFSLGHGGQGHGGIGQSPELPARTRGNNNYAIYVGQKGFFGISPVGKIRNIALHHRCSKEPPILHNGMGVKQARDAPGTPNGVLITRVADASLAEIITVGVIFTDKAIGGIRIAAGNAIPCGVNDKHFIGIQVGRIDGQLGIQPI